MDPRWRRRKKSVVGSKFGFRGFVYLLLGLGLMALLPIFFFYSRLNQEGSKECEWIEKPPLVCAHGGDTSRAPPNTLVAYKLALDAGVDCMEIDSSQTKDGVLVALHDRELNDMANTSGLRVGDLTFEQIQELNAARGFPDEFQGQKVPSLENALRYVSRFLKHVVVDVKVGPSLRAKDLAAEIKSTVDRTHCRNCIVWSKVDDVVRSYKRESQAWAGYIVMDTQKMRKPLRISSATVVGVFHGLIDKRMVSTIHKADKVVYAWTVNEEADMLKMLHHAVDCIITSQPRLLQQVMERERSSCQFI
ncbi:glycerophosphodiester phosphodiesterase GDPD4-like isoform X2 [Selaginella moellendorffii]|uniref:glycerophosphodiester phosphodiesterase GDPD4-like isoform X2 n=1 Tax=Selaginella moellendorffii TaxID=88036 RepID=UPI000D1C2157|nr:glycerophosphodiester phosphodiesterase GDPD4-like isoform X2 [Selaginella moellendorffii]|eukprot:XP_024535025.1 glycerophosphodiester phosphodiesterase GDPD4-like isoform X2 [Selaginella moellendorffii]